MGSEPTTDYARLTLLDIARMGVEEGRAYFKRQVDAGRTDGDSLAVSAGYANDDLYAELWKGGFGPAWEQYAPNISPMGGKVATTVRFQMDSDKAFLEYGEAVGEDGPRRWTGGAYYGAHVRLPDGTVLRRNFTGAGSGVQSVFDRAVIYVILMTMAALWSLHELAKYKLAHPTANIDA